MKEVNYFDPEVKKAAIEKGRSKSWTETAQQAPLPKPTRERGVSID
jgi:nitrate reductase beta subunit